MRVAVAISPSATRPADTEPRNIVARPADSAIAAARAPCKVKCSVVMNVTAAGRGSAPPTAALVLVWLLIARHLSQWMAQWPACPAVTMALVAAGWRAGRGISAWGRETPSPGSVAAEASWVDAGPRFHSGWLAA